MDNLPRFLLHDPRYMGVSHGQPGLPWHDLAQIKAEAQWRAAEQNSMIRVFRDLREPGSTVLDPAILTKADHIGTAKPRPLTAAEKALLKTMHPDWGPLRDGNLTEREAVGAAVHSSHQIMFRRHGGTDVICLGCKLVFNQSGTSDPSEALTPCPSSVAAAQAIEAAEDAAFYECRDVTSPPYAWRWETWQFYSHVEVWEQLTLNQARQDAQAEADKMRRITALFVTPDPDGADEGNPELYHLIEMFRPNQTVSAGR